MAFSTLHRELNLRDYYDITRRNANWILAPLFAGFVISFVAAWLTRDTYVSTAAVMIVPAQILGTIVPSLGPPINLAEQATLILSDVRLSALIKKFQLYQEGRNQPSLALIKHFRHNIQIVRSDSAGVTHLVATLRVSFSYPNRYRARDVVDALITRLVEGANETRRSNARATSEYLQSRILERGDRMAQLAGQLKDLEIKKKNGSTHADTDQQYTSLTREFRFAEENYIDFRQKLAGVTLSNRAQERAGEWLETMEPASLPQQTPSAPNRWMYYIVGTGSGLLVGLIAMSIKEATDSSLKSLEEVRAFTQLPILGSISFLEGSKSIRRRRAERVRWSSAIVLGVIAVVAAWYYHHLTNG